ATERISPAFGRSTSGGASRTFETTAIVPSELAVASHSFPGLYARALIHDLWRTWSEISRPSRGSHSRRVLSIPPVATIFPQGVTATDSTGPTCPRRTASSPPVVGSQIRAVWSCDPDTTR